jgi:hypothetical protein
MFHLSTTKFSRSVATLLEVLQLFHSDSRFRGIEAADVSLSHAGHPMCVSKFDGKLTVRMAGSMPDLFLAMLDEIDGAYFRPNGKRLEPWQIRRSHWQLLFFAFELSTRPLYLFTWEQVIAFANIGSASLFQLCEAEARARFGFGPGGPAISLGSGQINGRHEVHLAYALAAGVTVPEAVLADYAALAEPFGNDLRWARTLLTVPELRGVMPVSKLRVLISMMTHSRQSISSANAAVSAMVARLLPNEPTHAEVDDLLCRHGLLDARALTAKGRRRAIFALAGLDDAQQLEWEQRAAANRKAEAVTRDAERAKERAESARYRYGRKVITALNTSSNRSRAALARSRAIGMEQV